LTLSYTFTKASLIAKGFVIQCFHLHEAVWLTGGETMPLTKK
jgi:hypothetical protein